MDILIAPEGVALLWALTALVVLSNLHEMRTGAERLSQITEIVAPGLGALEVAGDHVDPSFVPLPAFAPWIHAGQYRSAVAAWGSPALPANDIPRTAPDVRRSSDAILVAALHPDLAVAPFPRLPGPLPQLERVSHLDPAGREGASRSEADRAPRSSAIPRRASSCAPPAGVP